MAEQAVIKVEHVSKDFLLPHEKITSVKSAFTGAFRHNKSKQVQHALKDISFEVKKGEFFGIVGRNGSGKSTMLKILAGIYQPTKGSVHTYGKLVPFIELGVGFNPELTGRENVFLNGAMLGFSRAEVAAMYDDVVAFAELEAFMDQKLKNYSSGMQVRLAFSMATRAKADILLVDEVLAVGDADFQRKCFDYFKKLKKAETTVIFVSHDMDAVREYCDRAMLIEKSEVVEVGSTKVVSQKYLQLFMKEAAPIEKTGSNQDRWGNGAARIDDISVVVDSKLVTIKHTVRLSRDIEDPIIGFRLRNAAGKDVTGTNTRIEQQKSGDLKSGQKITIIWSFPNFLSDGEYFVDPSVLYSDGITTCDWWNDAAMFAIKKDRHLPYVVDPGFSLTIK